MLAKVTSKNQITIPKKIIDQVPDTKYFEVEFKDGIIVLKPLRVYETDVGKIRAIKRLGLKPNSVREAVGWARKR